MTALGALASTARATITIIPSTPTEADSVRVRVGNSFATRCWPLLSVSCTSMQPDSVLVVATVQYCGGAPACNYGQFPFTYEATCEFGRLPAGSYIAHFDEVHVNPNDPEQSRTQRREFFVEVSTPARRSSWGTLKLIHH